MKRLRPSAVLVLLVALVAFVPAGAQTPAKRAFDLEDILAFRAIGVTTLSTNGQWLAYRLSPLQGDSEVVVRSTSGDKEWKFPVGEGAGGAATFSADSNWIAITTALTRREAEAARRARRPVQNSVTIVNLANGEKVNIPKIRRFEFAGETGGWIALHRYGPDTAGGAGAAAAEGGGRGGRGGGAGAAAGNAPRDTRPRGTDLILRELKSGTEINIGNVSEFAFNKSGRSLAMIIDAADQAGNGIQIRDMAAGSVTSLDTDKAFYERLAWTREGDALVALKGKDDRQWRERMFAVVGFTGFGSSGAPKRVAYDPADDKSFPAGMSVSGNRAPQWTEARDAISFGIAALTKAPPPAGRGRGQGAEGEQAEAAGGRGAGGTATEDETNSERPNLMIWHYKDPRLQSQQVVQENADRNFNYLALYRVQDNRMVRLADEEVPTLTFNGRGRWAIGTSDDAYELRGNLDGRRFQDVYAIDTRTGQKKAIKKELRWGNSPSPDGTKYLYYENQHFHVYDIEAGETRNITSTVPASFINREDDHNIIDPPTNVVGWTADNASVLISDRWDIWQVPVASGGTAVNLTVNGKKDAIRYQGRVQIYQDERGIDLTKPQYFSAMNEWTKKGGYGVLEPGKPGLKMLLWEDASFGRLTKAEKADVWIYSRETPVTATSIYVTDASLANGRKIIDTAKESDAFLWSSGAQLIEYKNDKGERLQGSLYLPANYQKGRQYPMVVYIYERLTQGHNQYGRPTANGFSRQAYTSNGYAVLQPDIKYYVNDPGMSAVWALVPAVKAAVATGIVDPKRVGLHGHSWGGYQTAHTITQTDIFAAAIAGAPLTNMISMYSIIYKNTGGTNGAIFESSQGRFTAGPWDQWAAYTRNSPVAHAKNVKTPLIILHNDLDGAVDFTQGMEYFNTLRRLGKPVILLEYPGENHGLARPANQQDYTVRMKEFFDHYLKGAPAPDWLQYGIPRLKMQEHIDQRLKERQDKQKVVPPAGGGRGGS
ncbi:MAG TPA: prolyl oligopeptidase family serine peptidase [Vicinamibacterales bacterium]